MNNQMSAQRALRRKQAMQRPLCQHRLSRFWISVLKTFTRRMQNSRGVPKLLRSRPHCLRSCSACLCLRMTAWQRAKQKVPHPLACTLCTCMCCLRRGRCTPLHEP